MCYVKPGPRCGTHVRNQITNTRSRIDTIRGVLNDLRTQRDQGRQQLRTNDTPQQRAAIQRAERKITNVEHKLLTQQMLLRHRQKEYAATVAGYTELQQRAKAIRQHDPRAAEQLYRLAAAGQVEHSQRIASYFHEHGDPRVRTKNSPRSTSEHGRPQGVFSMSDGWDGYEQVENSLVKDVLKEKAEQEWARLHGDEVVPSEGMRALVMMLKRPDLFDQLRSARAGVAITKEPKAGQVSRQRRGELFDPAWFRSAVADDESANRARITT